MHRGSSPPEALLVLQFGRLSYPSLASVAPKKSMDFGMLPSPSMPALAQTKTMDFGRAMPSVAPEK